MRPIKFRGKPKEPIPNKWFYGGYVRRGKKRHKHYIVNWEEKNMKLVQVDPKSIGEYTGLKDKNGKEIYEGDVAVDENNTFVVNHYLSDFILDKVRKIAFQPNNSMPLGDYYDQIEVIGNIYEHSHLLESD